MLLTMPLTLRELTPADDPRRADLLNLAAAEPVTAADLADWRRAEDPRRITYRVGAEDKTGWIAGYAHVLRDPWLEAGSFWTHVAVDPTARRRGVGTMLFEAVRDFARAHGATRYHAEARDSLPEALVFAERCGFAVERHIFESTLDLAAFDEARFAGAIERAEASGIRFFTLADEGDTEAARHKVWEVERRVSQDIPGGSEGAIRPFEAWVQQVAEASWYRPDAQIVAADGERWIGLSALGFFETPQPMVYQMITGVECDYRGRGIALALKLLGVRYARRYGAAYIRTNNDSQNAPILAVNRKLGFRPEPGYYRLLREGE